MGAEYHDVKSGKISWYAVKKRWKTGKKTNWKVIKKRLRCTWIPAEKDRKITWKDTKRRPQTNSGKPPNFWMKKGARERRKQGEVWVKTCSKETVHKRNSNSESPVEFWVVFTQDPFWESTYLLDWDRTDAKWSTVCLVMWHAATHTCSPYGQFPFMEFQIYHIRKFEIA